MDVILAGSVGATNTQLGVFDRKTHECLRTFKFWTDPTSPWITLDRIETEGKRLVRDDNLCAIGFGVAGVVTNGVVVSSSNLTGWKDVRLSEQLQVRFGVRCVAYNDCVMGGLGEYDLLGESLIYITWGTGVGGAVIHKGRPYPRWDAMEPGHMIVDRRSLTVCGEGCGQRGHLEAFVGGAHLEARLGCSPEQASDERWRPVLLSMAVGLHNLSVVNSGRPIRIGGGVMMKQAHRLPSLIEAVAALQSTAPTPVIEIASHGEQSELYGAAYAARQLLANR